MMLAVGCSRQAYIRVKTMAASTEGQQIARGKPQAGMGVSIGDYDRDGKLDIVKTNFAGDTDSLYVNLGDRNFHDRTYAAGLGINTRYLGWGVGFFDMDNDGWLDILVTNGHVYPEVSSSKAEAPYAERKYLYRNLHNGPLRRCVGEGRSRHHCRGCRARLCFR
jgi:hypothetical protein